MSFQYFKFYFYDSKSLVEKCLPSHHLSFTALHYFVYAVQKHWLKLNVLLISTLLCKSSGLGKKPKSSYMHTYLSQKHAHAKVTSFSVSATSLFFLFCLYLKFQCLQIKNSAQVFWSLHWHNVNNENLWYSKALNSSTLNWNKISLKYKVMALLESFWKNILSINIIWTILYFKFFKIREICILFYEDCDRELLESYRFWKRSFQYSIYCLWSAVKNAPLLPFRRRWNLAKADDQYFKIIIFIYANSKYTDYLMMSCLI